LISQISTTPLRVIIFDKDPQERWLIATYLRQETAREIETLETDRMSDIKIAVERGKADVVLIDMDTSDDGYWLDQILENQLAPVVMLTGQGTEESMSRSVEKTPVDYVSKSSLSREQLIETIETAIAKWHAIQRNLAHTDELERLVNFDLLTGLLNRRAILRKMEEAMTRARRYDEDVSLLLLDVDRFKPLNDDLGRAAADVALHRISTLLQKRVRESDHVGRYGGDEFLIILPHTDKDSAMIAAERIRKAVETLEMRDARGGTFSITVSGGVAAYEPGDDVASISYRAESCLCLAKENGRNRIEK